MLGGAVGQVGFEPGRVVQVIDLLVVAVVGHCHRECIMQLLRARLVILEVERAVTAAIENESGLKVRHLLLKLVKIVQLFEVGHAQRDGVLAQIVELNGRLVAFEYLLLDGWLAHGCLHEDYLEVWLVLVRDPVTANHVQLVL